MDVKRWASGKSFPSKSFLSFIDLNLMILKIFSFLPGRACKKKGFPLLAKVRAISTMINTGLSNSKPNKAARKSMRRLKKFLYMTVFCVGGKDNFYFYKNTEDTEKARSTLCTL